MKDKQTEREARQLITQAHKRGNAAVGKVVDYTRQKLGYLFLKSNQTNPINKNNTKQNKTKQNKTKQNKTKQNKTKQNKTKQNKTKQNKTKQNKTKQNKTTM